VPKRQQSAPWRVHNRSIPVARRGVMSLSLAAVILVAGPASGSARAPAHDGRDGKTSPTTRNPATTTRTTTARPPTTGRHNNLSPTRIDISANKLTHSSAKPASTSRQVLAAGPTTTVRVHPKQNHVAGTHEAGARGTGTHATGAHGSATHKAGQLLATKSQPATTTTARHVASPPPTQPARAPLGTFMVTCYDLFGHTADGAVAGMESVAVDPSVIPLGSTIYVPGIGERTADDTGGMIIGNHIDIWEPSYGQCADWGVRYLPVYRVR
jgi:3D (Asp-Asp-Asp) domain-containing protein